VGWLSLIFRRCWHSLKELTEPQQDEVLREVEDTKDRLEKALKRAKAQMEDFPHREGCFDREIRVGKGVSVGMGGCRLPCEKYIVSDPQFERTALDQALIIRFPVADMIGFRNYSAPLFMS
jgi:hypothetical protein